MVMADRLLEVAHHPYGLCVLKKCISEAKNHQELLLKQLVRHTMDLVQSPYGNFAIQHALEEWGGQRCLPILQKMEGRMMQLSIQKYSSNVVEKLFSSAPEDMRQRFIGELVASEKMSMLVNSGSSWCRGFSHFFCSCFFSFQVESGWSFPCCPGKIGEFSPGSTFLSFFKGLGSQATMGTMWRNEPCRWPPQSKVKH